MPTVIWSGGIKGDQEEFLESFKWEIVKVFDMY